MSDTASLGPWVRRFLLEHLVSERNLAVNTRKSYRDTLALLLPFASEQQRKRIDQLRVLDLNPKLLRSFLEYLELKRQSSVRTRNQRLGALHALARFIGEHSPEHVEWCAQVRLIPYKKCSAPLVGYMTEAEMQALLSVPDRRTVQGRRDYAVLLFLYNSGARASEAASLHVQDIDLHARSVTILGKGGRRRICPLWAATLTTLHPFIDGRDQAEKLFLNRCGQPLTRFGIHTLVERTTEKACVTEPSLRKKRVSPHLIRHSTATHLLRAGVDINTIRGWLGHASLSTTNVYAEIDLETKKRALAACEPALSHASRKPWKANPGIMEFLKTL